MKYLFGMLDKDFSPDIHRLTGLWDKDNRPIVKLDPEEKRYIGFGNVNEFERYS